MAVASFHLKVVTPEDVPFEGEVTHVMAPGAKGYLGILKDHADLVTPVVKGDLSFRGPDGKEVFFRVEGGFLEVHRNRVLVLTDKIEARTAARTR